MGVVYVVTVHLAPTEYDGGYRDESGNWIRCLGRMQDAARAVFAAYPEMGEMVVEVWEHGGWRLAWTRDGLIVGTANNTAAFDPRAVEWSRKVWSWDRVYLADWRKQTPEERYRRPTLKLARVG